MLLIGLRHYYLTTAKEVKKLEADGKLGTEISFNDEAPH